jgi:RNA polymerase sigma-70 factor (ECF subfamily)
MLDAKFRWPSADELERLMRAAQRGHAEAVEEMLEALRPSLVTFFGRRLSPDLAEDLAQLALLRISRAIARIDAVRADAYVSTVARNLLRTAYRVEARARGRDGSSDPAALVATDMSIDRRVEYEELVRAVHRAALKLRPGLREVAVGVLEGHSASDIAESLKVSPITVRTRLMRVRAILKAELSPYLERERHSSRREA